MDSEVTVSAWRDITNEAALRFIRRTLELGTTLPKLFLSTHDLGTGRVFSPMPREVELSRLMPAEPEAYDVWIREISDPFLPHQRGIEHCKAYVLDDCDHVCVFAEILRNKGESMSQNEATVCFTYENEVYFLIDKEQWGSTDAHQIYRNVLGGWSSAILLTKLPRGVSALNEDRELQRNQLEKLADNASGIMIGAYDGGGVLLWEKAS